jgi:hypothetical protein
MPKKRGVTLLEAVLRI